MTVKKVLRMKGAESFTKATINCRLNYVEKNEIFTYRWSMIFGDLRI